MRPCLAGLASLPLAIFVRLLVRCPCLSDGLRAGLERLPVEPTRAVRRSHQWTRHHTGEADLACLVLELDELLWPHPALDRVVPQRRAEVLGDRDQVGAG